MIEGYRRRPFTSQQHEMLPLPRQAIHERKYKRVRIRSAMFLRPPPTPPFRIPSTAAPMRRQNDTLQIMSTVDDTSCNSTIREVERSEFDVEKSEPSPSSCRRLRAHLGDDIDPDKAVAPLAAYSFMTGFMCVPFRPSAVVDLLHLHFYSLPIIVTRSLSRPSSSGADFRQVTSSRYDSSPPPHRSTPDDH